MDKLVESLGPAFAAGLAVQQLLEILGPILVKIKINRKIFLSLVSLVLGFVLAAGAGLHVLQAFGVANTGIWDVVVTGLIISGGTEGFNSIMKFMGYAKTKVKENLKSPPEGESLTTEPSSKPSHKADMPSLEANTIRS
jgi:hypothetical protein